MKALKIILIAIMVIIGLVLIVAAFLPDNVSLDSSISIKSQENVIFNQVNCLKNWDKWSPFKSDDMTNEFSGSAYGIGSMNTWESKEMGNGNMEIIESVPFSSITTSINFRKDGGGANGHWTFENTDEGVNVVWGIHMTELSYPFGRLMGMLAGTMMQHQFDKGLNQLKEVCEAMPDYTGIVEENVGEVPAFSIIDSCTIDEIGPLMSENYGKIMKYLEVNNIQMTDVPFAVYHKWDPAGYILVEAGIPADNSLGGENEIIASSLKAGRVVTFLQIGPYEDLEKTHNLIDKYITDCGLIINGAPWEEYISDPSTVEDPSQIQTLVCYPVM